MRAWPVGFVLSLFLAGACGGRYAGSGDGTDGGNEGGNEGGSAGSTSRGGSSTRGGTGSGRAGSVGVAGTASVGGSAPIGGTAAGGGFPIGGSAGCICPDIDCPPGYVPRPSPDGCCNVCQPLGCENLPCPAIACGPGSHLEFPPDTCCGVCVENQCQAERAKYFELRSQILEKYASLGCMTVKDCDIMYELNSCSGGCGVAVPAPYVKEIQSTLEQSAAMLCGSCAMPIPPCLPPAEVACIAGRCQMSF